MNTYVLLFLALGSLAASAASTNFQNIRGKNYYQLLGVSTTASEGEIKTAYREAMKKNHPDQGGNEERAKELNNAKDALLQTRAQYDSWLKSSAQSQTSRDAYRDSYRNTREEDERQRAYTDNRRQRSAEEMRATILHQIVNSALAQASEIMRQNPRFPDHHLADRVAVNLLYMQRELPNANFSTADLWRIFKDYTINPDVSGPQLDTQMVALAGAVFKIFQNRADAESMQRLRHADEIIRRTLESGTASYPLRSRISRMYTLGTGRTYRPATQHQSSRCEQAATGSGFKQKVRVKDQYGREWEVDLDIDIKFSR